MTDTADFQILSPASGSAARVQQVFHVNASGIVTLDKRQLRVSKLTHEGDMRKNADPATAASSGRDDCLAASRRRSFTFQAGPIADPHSRSERETPGLTASPALEHCDWS